MTISGRTLGVVLGLAADATAGASDGGAAASPPASSSPKALPSAHAARSRFDRFARDELLPGVEPRQGAELADILRTAPAVGQLACQELHRQLAKTVAAGAVVLHGSLAALLRPGACWRLEYDGGLRAGLGACLDASNGSVLAVWRIPEG